MEMEKQVELLKRWLKKNNVQINFENITASRRVENSYDEFGETNGKYFGEHRLEFSFVDMVNNATYEVNRPLSKKVSMIKQSARYIKEIIKKELIKGEINPL